MYALLVSGNVRCWGLGSALFGPLGYENIENVGDGEAPADAGDIEVGNIVTQIASGAIFTCALLQNGSVRCWGSSQSTDGFGVPRFGMLGYGNTNLVGDDETPAEAGDVPLF